MPKRKRKKKEDAPILPPLQFLESPIDMSAKVLSPEYGALNPMTVPTVAIQDVHNVSWVTPQFDNKLLRLRRGINETNRRSLSGVTSKYQPLDFAQADGDGLLRSTNDPLVQRCEGVDPCRRQDSALTRTENECQGERRLHRVCEGGNVDHNLRTLESTDKNSTRGPASSRVLLQPVCNRQDDHNTSHITTSSTKNVGNKQCDLDHSDSDTLHNSGEVNGDHGVLTGVRKILPLFVESLLCTPPMRVPRVLAVNTPEAEYGLTMRQRQLKYL